LVVAVAVTELQTELVVVLAVELVEELVLDGQVVLQLLDKVMRVVTML
jgi:hypothetical protein